MSCCAFVYLVGFLILHRTWWQLGPWSFIAASGGALDFQRRLLEKGEETTGYFPLFSAEVFTRLTS